MNMKKKLLNLAVATTLAAPAAAMADAVLYGKLHVSIDYFDINSSSLVNDLFGDHDQSFWTLNRGREGRGVSRANRIGVKGSEDLGGGLKAIYQVEFGISLANESDLRIANGDKGSVSMRNSFVGLAGGWGTFLVGRHDTPMKISTGKLDLFADTMADYNGTIGFQDIRADNAIAYISPSFSGFQLAAAIVPGGGATVEGVFNPDSDSLAEAYSIAAIYKNGPFYGAIAYESLQEDLLATDSSLIAPPGVVVVPDDSFDKWRVGLGLLNWNGFTLTGIYENQNFIYSDDLWQIQAAYAFGNNTIKGSYGQVNKEDDRIIKRYNSASWTIGFDHNFSKRTKAYILYTSTDREDIDIGDWSGFSLGMVHKF